MKNPPNWCIRFVGRTVYQLFRKILDIKGIDLDDNADYKIDILEILINLKNILN